MTYIGYGTAGAAARRSEATKVKRKTYSSKLIIVVACKEYIEGTPGQRRKILDDAGFPRQPDSALLLQRARVVFLGWEDARKNGLPVPKAWLKARGHSVG